MLATKRKSRKEAEARGLGGGNKAMDCSKQRVLACLRARIDKYL